MKYVRLSFPLALLLVAAPAFAICGYCNEADSCTWSPGLGTRCYYELGSPCGDVCVEESSANCNGFTESMASFSTAYRIVSVTVENAKASPIKQESTAVSPKKLKKTT